MVFSSLPFLLVFLPAVLLAVSLARREGGHGAVVAALLIASWLFYALWDWRFVPLLWGSILFNHGWARLLIATADDRRRHRLLALGVAANLLVLGFFKYAGWLAGGVEALAGGDWGIPGIALPLGLSFITFQKIAFLVDTARTRPAPYRLADFALFASFFPQLVAGPIVHHGELLPQIRSPRLGAAQRSWLAMGLTVLAIGLVKKVVLADMLAAPYSDAVFALAERGEAIAAPTAWAGSLAYGLQLYFDFSGYADMAIGLALMLRVELPDNFANPYAAGSPRAFWRRWHITLSRFLRDYLYVPLGGSRRGRVPELAAVMATMLLGGLWHGAGWTFLLWGALHGLYLAAQRTARWLEVPPLPAVLGWSLTLLAVTFAWVPFRADDLGQTAHLWSAMLAGPWCTAGPLAIDEPSAGILVTLTLLLTAAAVVPEGRPLAHRLQRGVRSGAMRGAIVGLLLAVSLIGLDWSPPFLYFQF